MSEPRGGDGADNVLALLNPYERALLAEDRACCLTCGAADQGSIRACLRDMNACVDLRDFAGIPCTLEERDGPMTPIPVFAYPLGTRVRFTPPIVNVPYAMPFKIVGRMVTELPDVPVRISYVLQPWEMTGTWAVDQPLMAGEGQIEPWPEDPPQGEETPHAQSVKHDCPMGQSALDDRQGWGATSKPNARSPGPRTPATHVAHPIMATATG